MRACASNAFQTVVNPSAVKSAVKVPIPSSRRCFDTARRARARSCRSDADTGSAAITSRASSDFNRLYEHFAARGRICASTTAALLVFSTRVARTISRALCSSRTPASIAARVPVNR